MKQIENVLNFQNKYQDLLEFSPKDFIMPPFDECPKCKQQSYGILSIENNSFTRRCRECWHTQNYTLPSLRKKIIYLDQCAISEMMKALNPNSKANQIGAIDSFWITLFEKLDSLIKLQLIVCPNSFTHIEESCLSSDPLFNEDLQKMYELLSNGISFHDSWRIKRSQIRSHLTGWLNEQPHTFTFDAKSITSGNLHGWKHSFFLLPRYLFSQEVIDDQRDKRNLLFEDIKEVFARWKSEKDKTFDDWFKEEVKGFGNVIWKFGISNIIHPAQIVLKDIRKVIKKHGFSNGELMNKDKEYLESPCLENIPFLNISSMMWAAIARKAANGQKNPPSKGMNSDITTISTLLPYCDAMFIDNECRALLSENPVKDRLKNFGETRLFSSNKKIRNEFIEYLDNIKKEASLDHLELVKRLYGDDIKPFTTLYKNDSFVRQ